MTTIDDIKRLTENYAEATQALAEVLNQHKASIETLQQRQQPEAELALDRARAARQKLAKLIADHPQLFKKPRTKTFFGIKVGYQQGKPQLATELSQEEIVDRIRVYLPECAKELIRTKRTPINAALAELEPSTLKTIGISKVDGSDRVVIKIPSKDLEATING